MEEKNLQQRVADRMKELPSDVRQAIQSSDLDGQVQTIAQKHSLHIDQAGILVDETLAVMLGFSDFHAFVGTLKNKLGVSDEAANNIAGDINDKIFLAIRQSLQKFSEKDTGGQGSVTPPVSTSTPPTANPTPTQKPEASTPTPPPAAPVSKPASTPDMHAADMMLSEKTVHMAPSAPSANPATEPKVAPTPASPVSPQQKPAPAQPEPYKADPYREPPE